MSSLVAGLVLLSALMHAGWNYLVKRGADAQLDTVGFAVGCSLIALFLLPLVPLPDTACIPWLTASLVVHTAYFLSLAEAYRHADLSLTYPLMRGLAPILLAGLSPLAGELITQVQMAGILLIGLGIGLPAWAGKPWVESNRKGLYIGIFNAFIIAIYTLVDGMGVRHSANAASYTLWLFLFNSWGILAVMTYRRGFSSISQHLRHGWAITLTGSAMSMASYGIVLWAMTQASIPAVASLREISVVFAALLGIFLLKEQMGRWRVLGSVLVGFGAATVRWA